MSKARTILWIVIGLVVVAVWAAISIGPLGEAKRQVVTMGTFNVGRDLIASTNSNVLISIAPDLQAYLAKMLATPTHIASVRLGDEASPPAGPSASSVLLLTNDVGDGVALRLRLHNDETHTLRFDVLSHRKITEPGGSANRSQPGGSETNRTSATAGSGG